jgi:NAD(P)-dependent dehydrogenase (short-subunit alcohol dehydrogenase family)
VIPEYSPLSPSTHGSSPAVNEGTAIPSVVVITGASQGLGAALARAFAAAGPSRLALIARRREELAKVAQVCATFKGVETMVLPCDVTDPAQVEAAAAEVTGKWGTADILINNAGAFTGGSFLTFSLDDFDHQLAVNLRSVFVVSRAFVKPMVEKGRGDIVNICSIAALQAHPGGTGYCAAKAGLLGLTRVMRAELKKHGIRVTAVHPGAIATPSWDGFGVPEDRMMAAEDVAQAVVDLTRLSRRTVIEDLILRPLEGDL